VQQVADGIGVFVAVQAVQGGACRRVMRGIQAGDDLAREGVDLIRRGPRFSGRRHHAGLQLAQYQFPDFGVTGDVAGIEHVQRQAARPVLGVVAAEAVLLNEAVVECPVILASGDGREQGGGKEQLAGTDSHHRTSRPRSCSSFVSSAIDSGFGSSGWVARNTPLAQSSAVRPSLSARVRSAPLATRYSMMSLEPRLAAPCRAVMPMELAWFRSMPSAWQSLTASSSCSGPSVQVWATTQFTPAAAI